MQRRTTEVAVAPSPIEANTSRFAWPGSCGAVWDVFRSKPDRTWGVHVGWSAPRCRRSGEHARRRTPGTVASLSARQLVEPEYCDRIRRSVIRELHFVHRCDPAIASRF